MTTAISLGKVLVLATFIAFISCNYGTNKSEPVWSDLSEVTSLKNFEHTDFVVTLENPISENKNIIYAPAFLYAWDKIREKLRSPIIITSQNSIDFSLLNKSISHQKSLTENEYSATVEIVDGSIIARAFFNKTLPFETKLQVLDEPIKFDSTNVSSFGMYYFNEDAINIVRILYYKDDNNFILKLVPKDKQHEIILVKGLEEYQNLKEAIKLTNDLIAQGELEQTENALLWKYRIVRQDIFAIPVIKFNIETNYKNIEKQSFSTGDNKEHFVEVAYQRTGFVMNENGAVVESEAVAMADSIGAEPTITHPKKMIFDRPFLIIIKRADLTNPYFVMRVANTELLIKK